MLFFIQILTRMLSASALIRVSFLALFGPIAGIANRIMESLLRQIHQVNDIRRRSDYIIGFIAPAIGPNKSGKLTRLIAPAHNIRGKV